MKRRVRLKERNQKLLPTNLRDVQRKILREEARALRIENVDSMSIRELSLAIAQTKYREGLD